MQRGACIRLKIAVVEDCAEDRQRLVDFIHRYGTQNHVSYQIHIFDSGEKLLAFYKEERCDVVFLDIYLKGMDGMQTAHLLRDMDTRCLLVFTTSSTQFAVASFRVRAFDYLLKPFDFDQFSEVMGLCEKQLRRNALYIRVKEGRLILKVPLKNIIYTDYYNHYIQIHTKERMIRSYQSFPEFSEKLLIYPQFLCCYRNCLINMDHVKSLEEKDFVMSGDIRVPIGRSMRTQARQIFADYMFEKLYGTT